MKENNMTFERLGDLRPHGSRLNLDSFEDFNKAEVEKKVELRKQLLIKKAQLLKSLEQEGLSIDEAKKELANLYNVEVEVLEKALESNEVEKGGMGSGKYMHKKKPLPVKGTPEWHKLQIAKKTMKMSDAGVQMMGGQTKEEAGKILKEYGLLKSEIDEFEKGNKSYPIGTIHNGYKKIAEGKWRKVGNLKAARNGEHGNDFIENVGKKHKDFSFAFGSDTDSMRSLLKKGKIKEAIKAARELADIREKFFGKEASERVNWLRSFADKMEKFSNEKKDDGKDLEKGIMSDLSYSLNGKEGLNFAKTGKEIKAQLPAMISKLQTKLAALQTKQAELAEEIGVAPDEESIFYGTDEIYKRYSSNLCYGEKGSDLSNNTSTDEQKLMRQYNDLQYSVNDLKRDISIGEAMVRNLDDKKKYTLSISQIASLGF